MSHLVTVKNIKLTNTDALDLAIQRLNNVKDLGVGSHHLYSGNIQGRALMLEGATVDGETCDSWRFPVVVKDNGEVVFDNYGGHWGKQLLADQLIQEYSAAVIELEAQAHGMTVQSEEVENGDRVLTCTQY